MTTSTSLNLRATLKAAIARSRLDAPARNVSGLTPVAKTLFVAAASQTMPHGAVLYVVPGDGDLEEATRNIRFFVSALEGLSDAAADRAILPFPSHEVDPYRGMAPHSGVTSARARALHGLATGTARIVVASAAALLPKISAPERLLRASIDLKPGQDIGPIDLGEILVDGGFTREDPVDEHGEFAIRGGILDVFPPGEPNPVRLEFVGDTVETLRTFDPATQRSIQPIDQISIVPLRDVFLGREATLFDYLALASASRIIVSERDEVDANIIALTEQFDRSYEDAVVQTPEVPQPDDILLDSTEVTARFAHATTVAELGLDMDVAGPRLRS